MQGLPNLMKAIDWGIDRYPSGTVFSMSFGTDEAAFASPAAAKNAFARFDQTFSRGQAKGDTFLSSSGDDGSVGVTRAHKQTATAPDPEVSYPNVSPYVTSVGGTQVQSGWTWNPSQDKPFNDDGSRNPLYWAWTPSGSSEAVWNESWASIATGGGLSTVYPRPAYQNSVASVVGTHRGVPDCRVERCGQRRRARLLVVLPGHQRSPQLGRLRRDLGPVAAGRGADGDRQRVAPGVRPTRARSVTSTRRSTARRSSRARRSPTSSRGPTGRRRAECLQNNQIWDLGADGFVTPGPGPRLPDDRGLRPHHRVGQPPGFGYVDNLLNQP